VPALCREFRSSFRPTTRFCRRFLYLNRCSIRIHQCVDANSSKVPGYPASTTTASSPFCLYSKSALSLSLILYVRTKNQYIILYQWALTLVHTPQHQDQHHMVNGFTSCTLLSDFNTASTATTINLKSS
jgi:hypothetical protein